MPKLFLGSALTCALLLGAAAASAQPATCTRDELKAIADTYIDALNTGIPIKMPMTLWVDYTEQFQTHSMSTGIFAEPRKVDYHRTFIDTQSCTTFTEVVINDPAHPYVVGTRLGIRGGQVGQVETLVTDADDWLFNAANTLKYAQAENWSEIPAAERDSRATLLAAANAYLDLFNDKNVKVPWGSPCARLEGGMYTGKGAPGVSTPEDSCSVGVPSGVKIVERRYVVDEALGAVTVINVFGNNQLPDAHTFRVEKGKLRYVHTITVCKTFNCGFKPPTGTSSPTATAEPIAQPAAATQPAAKPAARPAARKPG